VLALLGTVLSVSATLVPQAAHADQTAEVIDGGGVIPAQDPTAPDIPDSAQVAAHAQDEASVSASVAEQLAALATTPATEPSSPSAPGTPIGESGLTRNDVPPAAKTFMAPASQQYDKWCVPATAYNVIATEGDARHPQSLYASLMGTSMSSGTYAGRLAPALRHYARWYYIGDQQVASQGQLLDRISYDVYYQKTGVGLFVNGAVFKWWQDNGQVQRSLHAMLAYGYNLASTGTVYIYDPLNVTWAGYQQASAHTTLAGEDGNGDWMTW
jgi:hypothetical protein